MNLHLPVLPRMYGSALNEAESWKQRATAAEDKLVDLLAENGVLTARVETVERQLTAAVDAAEGLRGALDAGAAKSETLQARDVDTHVLALQKQLATAKEQLARQDTALTAYERAHQELLDDLRSLAEQRDTALATIERMSRQGAWTPTGAAS